MASDQRDHTIQCGEGVAQR